MVDLFEKYLQGQQAGQAKRRQRTLSENYLGAVQGDQSALAQVYSADPEAGMQAQTFGQQQQRAQRQEADDDIIRASKFYLQTKSPQAWSYIHQKFSADPRFQGMPATIDTPENLEGSMQFANALVNSMGGADQQSLAPRVIGDALVDPQGRVLYQAPTQQDYQWSDRAGAWIPKPTGPMGGQPTAPSPQAQAGAMDYGPAETDNYVRSIMGKVGTLDPNASPEQLAETILPHLIQQESAGNPNAVSPKGARGLTQVMPATGRDPGFGVAPLRDNSPQENVRFGRDYLTAMLKRYPGRPDLALAAYNSGPGAADKLRGRTTPAQSQGLQAIPVAGISPKEDRENAPSGYRFDGSGNLVPIPGGPADRRANPMPADLAKAEMAMRKELSDELKSPKTVVSMYSKVQAAAKNPTAANDLALIFAYMKMLDPGSVVREQEFANAQNAAGVPDRIRNVYNRAMSGQRLAPAQRAEFVGSAQQLAESSQAEIDSRTAEYMQIATEYGYDPYRATGAPRAKKPAQQGSMPKPAGGGWKIQRVK